MADLWLYTTMSGEDIGILAPGVRTRQAVCEVAWFADLCGGDTDQLGIPDPALRSSFRHCRDIVVAAEDWGFSNILLPTSYMIGQEVIPFAASMSQCTSHIMLLTALRMGEIHPPMLARHISTLDHMLEGRLTVNVINSPLPGLVEDGRTRYVRTEEIMEMLRSTWHTDRMRVNGEFYSLDLPAAPSKPYQTPGPLLYFGGFSDAAREIAAKYADVFLLWPPPEDELLEVIRDVSSRALRYGRTIDFGLRIHVVVRESEQAARSWASHLARGLADAGKFGLKGKTQDSLSAGVLAQNSLRAQADAEGYAEGCLWTTIGTVRSGAGAAIVGDPVTVRSKLERYMSLGFRSFILSGYPLLDELKYFGDLVLADLPNVRLAEQQGRVPLVRPSTPLTDGSIEY